MGCDGGTIPKRCELVREKKKPEKVDKEIELNAKWFHCAISQQELCQPIVACELGNLYRKEAVLEYLLDKSKATTDVARHIRNLKDVKELVLTRKPNYKEKGDRGHAADVYLDFQASDYICPITGLEMNGRYKFCFSWKCGCVFSERGLKEVPSKQCHNCGSTDFDDDHLIIINGNETEVEKLKEKMAERRQRIKDEKKVKKSKRLAVVEDGVETKKAKVSNDESTSTSCKEKKVHPKSDLGNSKSKSTEVSTKKAKVSNDESTSTSCKEKKVHPKSDLGNSKSKSTEVSTKKTKVSNDKSQTTSVTGGKDDDTKSDFVYSKYKSVAENPEATKVFKSLFSSGHKEKPKHLQSNWVTYHSYHC